MPFDPSDENLFDRMANLDNLPPVKKFQRSKKNIILAGVCGGIAEYLNEDPAKIRLAALMTLLLGGWGAAAYLVAAMLMPPGENSPALSGEEKKSLGREQFKTVLGGTMIVAGIYFALQYTGIPAGDYFYIISSRFVLSAAALIIGALILTGIWGAGNDETEIYNTAFAKENEKKLILGVCAGTAHYLKTDPVIVRIVFFMSTLLTLGLFGVIYLMLAVFMPAEEEKKFE